MEKSKRPRAKHIGIAGVSTEGAFLCARTIQGEAERQLPAEQRPQISLHMHPFAAYSDALSRSDMGAVAGLLIDSIDRLRRAGAEFAIIPANAVHIAIDEVSRGASIPVLNLVEEVALESERRGYGRVAVLGAQWTMRSGLYDGPMRRRGIEPIIPGEEDQRAIHSIITEELFAFRVREESTARLLAIVEKLKARGCQAVVLACTELPLALNEENCGVGVLDTTRLLAERALAFSRAEAERKLDFELMSE